MIRDDDLVWSSDGGRSRPEPDEPASAPAGAGGGVRVSLQTKGRRGKTVTVIGGLDLPPADLADLADLAGELKRRCGVGGTAKDGLITLQGDQRGAVAESLRRRGLAVTVAGR